MTTEETEVWNVIKNFSGKENAVNTLMVSQRTGLNERKIRDVFRYLRLEHGKLIGSSTDGGYFICSSLEELKECFATALNYENHNRENRQFFEEAMESVKEGQTQIQLL